MPDTPLPSLRAIMTAHGLDARKSLGQHFLLDPGITARIAGLAGDLRGRHVVEIGPGPGGLTRALLETPAETVHAVEIDQRAWPLLEDLAAYYPHRLHIVQADATRLDATTLSPTPRQIVANLPYNVGTPLLIGWLRQAAQWERLTLMFQAEVGERICAAPDTSAYGRLAVLAQWCAECRLLMKIPPGAFTPPPKVDSVVVGLIPHAEQPEPALFRTMERITALAFGQRRKMLRSSLKAAGGEALLERAGIAPTRRAETLSVAEFAQLAALVREDQA
ncbi:dimethyladenosine transferase [Neoasaia chiangmaiensis NBRC 101099]|uniref:Ribosomal RNA small subunit methyltransferase A n=1 Tax=Neoasaia chiangmaiensis TaxID=320497 RepID=A0A1U9KST4_9PROT|nr:16S rRNA (adenine(1518)-N(6)/adenine(1519)-N(6))-dimethyltransferase RsmA [Neoasaia chiangmaiensis]AQS88845.1 16S rRNA (adenine(1518)-N(6)/adenine(1519)-N(6))-dimethyltransferase [Neoasaia chiangmaiensis]GBR40606.1 dimethyladenosine transferase [Neoasaia chiangmaiensis NBRC 101099]GEN13819.1 ribosomal RNA small subunit methyltransferase A [Neoasaia chiangmaiensis]